MRAIILAGGRGQRLMPLTDGRPKPLVPFLDRPILDYTLAQLGAAGFTDVVITLGYEGARIRAHVGTAAAGGSGLATARRRRRWARRERCGWRWRGFRRGSRC
ncbi:protein of unknown function [Candidatus Hydrogenisulfobacillus filiaventi]|uniref:Nucleotidyl transferase domain-containing protein n=1 Tax=Candidatus Hydrogenisulfobacillus filiaventi TaxID=2707344 RepID=A0A6F8ZD37_9FIRM|nr:protein of unknown function [Candidatus Hydrogenisulfobacillus filiaventi]